MSAHMPYDAETLQNLAEAEAVRLNIPEVWREDAIAEFVAAAYRAAMAPDQGIRAYQYRRGLGMMLNFLKRELRRDHVTPGSCTKGVDMNGKPLAARISLDTVVSDGDGQYTELADTIPDNERLSPLENLIRKERALAVRKALAELPASEREAARRVFMEDESQESAAAAMGITRKTLRGLLAVAREKLTERLAAYADDEDLG